MFQQILPPVLSGQLQISGQQIGVNGVQRLLAEMLYLIARDNEGEGLIQRTARHPAWFEALCRCAVRSPEPEARWQPATDGTLPPAPAGAYGCLLPYAPLTVLCSAPSAPMPPRFGSPGCLLRAGDSFYQQIRQARNLSMVGMGVISMAPS
mgnify:CR=1 FL=1